MIETLYYFGALPFVVGIIVAYISDCEWWEKVEKEGYTVPRGIQIFYVTAGFLSGIAALIYLAGAIEAISGYYEFAFHAIQGVSYIETYSISGLWLSYIYHKKKVEHEQRRKRG